MPTIYFLDTPEFAPVVGLARHAGMEVSRQGDYLAARSGEPEVVLERRHAPVRPSIWYAALTGGMDGRIVVFNDDELRIADA